MTLDCTLEVMDFLSQSDSFTIAEIDYYVDSLSTNASYSDVFKQDVPVNGYVYCKCKDRAGVVLRRKQDSYVKVSPVTFGRVKPINMEQYALSDALNDTSIQLLTVTGKAGTGKTLLTMAWAIDQITMKKGQYKRLVLTKPRVQTTDEGEPMGELPGPQPLTAKILCPSGWRKMGDLNVGDEVISATTGKPVKVLGVYPKGVKDVYRLTTTEGQSTLCCDNHLWFTKTLENIKRTKPGSVKSTREIRETLLKRGKPFHRIPRNAPAQLSKIKLPIDPYLLGVLLGDGHFGESISFASVDLSVVEEVKEILARDFTCDLVSSGIQHRVIFAERKTNKVARPVFIENLETGEVLEYETIGDAAKVSFLHRATLNHRCSCNLVVDGIKYSFGERPAEYTNPLKIALASLGLLTKRAIDKSIPEIYMRASLEDRLALLQGLMDTDGTIKDTGEASFCSISKDLATGVRDLTRSLGGRANLRLRSIRTEESAGSISSRKIIPNHPTYEFTVSLPTHINPFRLSRKAEKHSCTWLYEPYISSIEPAGSEEVQCILIDDPDHLYVTDDYIVTHNTMGDKMAPQLASYLSAMGKIMGPRYKEWLELSLQNETIVVFPLEHMRGIDYSDSIVICDEVQNIGPNQYMTLATRINSSSRLILMGDVMQSDFYKYKDQPAFLSYATSPIYRRDKISAHVNLVKAERGPVPDLVLRIKESMDECH